MAYRIRHLDGFSQKINSNNLLKITVVPGTNSHRTVSTFSSVPVDSGSRGMVFGTIPGDTSFTGQAGKLKEITAIPLLYKHADGDMLG